MELKIGCKSNEVKQLQIMLNSLGYNCGTADGIFGNLTSSAINAYKTAKYINGVYDGNTAYLLVNDYNKKLQEEINQTNSYRKIRMFDTNIHIYETSPDEFVDVTLGIQGKLEPLSKIDDPNKIEVCKINGGFFNFDCSREHLGLFIRDGKVIQNYDNTYINFAYNKDESVDITYVDNCEWINYWSKQSHWVIGCGWSLVKDGKIDITGSTIFEHSKSKNPRSMIGITNKKSFILAVADGRTTTSKGLTAKEQAEVMLSLECTYSSSLDGGGSSEMIVNDKIMNSPSDKSERKIGSAIIVYKK